MCETERERLYCLGRMNRVIKELTQTDPNQQRVQQDKEMPRGLNNQHLAAGNASRWDLGTELENKVSDCMGDFDE